MKPFDDRSRYGQSCQNGTLRFFSTALSFLDVPHEDLLVALAMSQFRIVDSPTLPLVDTSRRRDPVYGTPRPRRRDSFPVYGGYGTAVLVLVREEGVTRLLKILDMPGPVRMYEGLYMYKEEQE